MIPIKANCLNCGNLLTPTENYLHWRQVHNCRKCRKQFTALFKLEEGKLIVNTLLEVHDGREHETDSDTQP